MSSKKKKKGHSHKQEASSSYHPSPGVELTPSRHRQKDVQPHPFPTKFKEVLRVSSPAVPPGLLKMHSKRTDGKVRRGDGNFKDKRCLQLLVDKKLPVSSAMLALEAPLFISTCIQVYFPFLAPASRAFYMSSRKRCAGLSNISYITPTLKAFSRITITSQVFFFFSK